MIVGRGWILQARELRGECLLLGRRGREQKQHPAQNLAGRRCAQVSRVQSGGLLWGMATGAVLRQSLVMREAGADALAAGEVCAAAPDRREDCSGEQLQAADRSFVAASYSSPYTNSADLASSSTREGPNLNHPSGNAFTPHHFLGSGSRIRLRFALIV